MPKSILCPLILVLWGCTERPPAVTYQYLNGTPSLSDQWLLDFDYPDGKQAEVVEELKRAFYPDIEGKQTIPEFSKFEIAESDSVPAAGDMLQKVERVWKAWSKLPPVNEDAAKKIAQSIQNVVYELVGKHFPDHWLKFAFWKALSLWLEPWRFRKKLHQIIFRDICEFVPDDDTLFRKNPELLLGEGKADFVSQYFHKDGIQYAIPEDLEKRLGDQQKDFCCKLNREAVRRTISIGLSGNPSWESYSNLFHENIWDELEKMVDTTIPDGAGRAKDFFQKIEVRDGGSLTPRMGKLKEFLFPSSTGSGVRLGFFSFLIAGVTLAVLVRSAQLPMRGHYTEIELTSRWQSVL